MGREIRRVPKGWEHPKDHKGKYKPICDESYEEALKSYEQNPEDWDYTPPDKDYYRPSWPTEPQTCYQIYETVSEGTPVSPVFDTEDEMKEWLLEQGYTKGAVYSFIRHRWAPSMTFGPEGLIMGIASMEYI